MAEGKLMYHCSLALRLMSWTLVGKPMVTRPFVVSSHITRYHKSDRITTWIIRNAFYLVKSQSRVGGYATLRARKMPEDLVSDKDCQFRRGVEISLDAARTSACAKASHDPLRENE
jgi:hypothetical protein